MSNKRTNTVYLGRIWCFYIELHYLQSEADKRLRIYISRAFNAANKQMIINGNVWCCRCVCDRFVLQDTFSVPANFPLPSSPVSPCPLSLMKMIFCECVLSWLPLYFHVPLFIFPPLVFPPFLRINSNTPSLFPFIHFHPISSRVDKSSCPQRALSDVWKSYK